MTNEISLAEAPLDAVLGADGLWTGPGSEHLNAGVLKWPTRIDFQRLGGPEHATIEFIKREGHFYDLDYAKRELADGMLSIAVFRVVAEPGARITGALLVEAK